MPRRINIGVVQQHQKDCQSPKGVELRNLLHVHAGKRSAPVERTPNLKSSRQTLLRDYDHSLLLWTTVLFPTRGSYTSAASHIVVDGVVVGLRSRNHSKARQAYLSACASSGNFAAIANRSTPILQINRWSCGRIDPCTTPKHDPQS